MKCQICGNEMEKGFLEAYKVLLWSQKKHKLSLAQENGEVGFYKYNPFSYMYLDAYICKQCKKIVIDYENSEYQEG